MNANQAVNRAAESASARYGNITPQEVQRAAQYVFNSPTQDDIIRYMMGQGAAQAASSPSPDEQATMMAGTPMPTQQTPTQQEQAAVAAQAAPVASQAASTAAQVQNNADAAGTQAAPQADYSQQLNDVIAQANRVGIGQPMSLGERGVLSQILGAKDMYNAAQDDNGRAAAHALADAYRQAGQQYGLNDTSAGLDATQLRALLQTDYDMGVNNAMQGKTSAEYFDDQYNALRQAGLTRSEATDKAARRAQRYQNERVRNLTNAYYTYGVDRDGSMNNNGAAILNLIYDEQPASAAMGMQNYATPIQNWKFNKNQEAANNAYQQKLDYGQHTFDWTRILNNDKFTAQEKMQAIANELQKYLANLKIDADLKKAQIGADTAVQVANIRGAGKSGSGSGGSSDSSGDGKAPTDAQKTLMENAEDIYRNSSNSLDNVGEAIANLDKIEQKLPDDDVRQRIEDMKYALNARREFVSWNDHGRTGSADNAIDYYDSVSDANKDLVDDLKGLYDSASHS